MKADELKHAADTYNNSIINLKIDDILNTAKLKSEKGMYNMSINYYQLHRKTPSFRSGI